MSGRPAIPLKVRQGGWRQPSVALDAAAAPALPGCVTESQHGSVRHRPQRHHPSPSSRWAETPWCARPRLRGIHTLKPDLRPLRDQITTSPIYRHPAFSHDARGTDPARCCIDDDEFFYDLLVGLCAGAARGHPGGGTGRRPAAASDQAPDGTCAAGRPASVPHLGSPPSYFVYGSPHNQLNRLPAMVVLLPPTMGSAGHEIIPAPPDDLHRWPAKVISVLTGGEVDDDSTISVRYNGRCFCIHMSPRFLHNSPKATALYLRNLQAIHPEGPGEFEDILDEDVYRWVIQLFLPILMRLAPEPLPSFDPDKIRTREAKPLLSEYLFPETFGCRLEAIDETFIPRHTDNHGGLIASRTWLNEDTLNDLETWARFFDPSEIEVYFTKPEHALDRMPTKSFGIGITGGPLNMELDVYKNIHTSGLSEGVLVGRLVGIAHEHEGNSTLGLLLRYIDHRGTLYNAVEDDPGPELRAKWAAQINKAVNELHKIGSVWGDAKPENVLIDKEDNAWITDFEGGYTHGWVDPDKAGTVEGDLQGLQRTIRFIFEGPQDNTCSSPGEVS
ncbi:Uncharacterized protein TPAR_06715 [Tolypocladium paradoxum]|uniref:Protein kinase domain-containing protein n=1 Tax=Tolypocladium paradoxum TaxID=94208 RepID=A0A2S4KSA7_9HYPO|nr:Uncharacterized protein TPAR_06715 [Tolypocladium paradoxum]